jgi:hypothetical protein
MKISTFKVPVKLTRESGGINLEVKVDEKTLSSDKELGEGAENDILNSSNFAIIDSIA